MSSHAEQLLSDFDDPNNFDAQRAKAEHYSCKSFAVQFAAREAFCGLNLTTDQVGRLLEGPRYGNASSPCLWLNLWGWTEEHQAMIRHIARKYGLSPRVAHSMCPRGSRGVGRSGQSADQGPGTSSASSITSMADIFTAVWHFGTVDFGRRYVCIGWNALFFNSQSEASAHHSKPDAVRLWSTILLCDDGTVVSVFETPPTADVQAIHKTRQNQLNILCSLSKARAGSQSALMQTSIRHMTSADSSSARLEMASLLFYYLFDDWINMFEQVSGSQHSYRRRLEEVRQEMIRYPKSEQIDQLHLLGRHLSALRSVCKSYLSIINQLVRNLAAKPSDSQTEVEESVIGTMEGPRDVSTVGSATRLPASAVARFVRLRDRIDLCAITELDECLVEKDGLVQMNFNLITLKQAQTVEKLTRNTILLAKLTALFLPLSLVMSYFSTELQAVQATATSTFWLTFMVTAIVSAIFLITFEWLSTKFSGQLVYKSLTSIFIDKHRHLKANKNDEPEP